MSVVVPWWSMAAISPRLGLTSRSTTTTSPFRRYPAMLPSSTTRAKRLDRPGMGMNPSPSSKGPAEIRPIIGMAGSTGSLPSRVSSTWVRRLWPLGWRTTQPFAGQGLQVLAQGLGPEPKERGQVAGGRGKAMSDQVRGCLEHPPLPGREAWGVHPLAIPGPSRISGI